MSSNLFNTNCALSKNWCNIQTQVHQVDFNWTIINFEYHEAKGADLKSTVFSATTNDKFKWYLLCKPNGMTEKKDAVSVYIYLYLTPEQLAAGNIESVFSRCTVSILDRQLKIMNEFSSNSPGWGWAEFLKKDQDFRNKFLINDELTLNCRLQFSKMKNIEVSLHLSKPKISESNLSDDLGLLYENREFSDVVLFVKGKQYPVHKNILAARSPVFAAIFGQNINEAEQKPILIEDVNEEVMGEILRYIYTGKCQNLKRFAKEILAAADKYALDRLKMICAEEILETLSVENAPNILVLADLYRVAELKSETIKFIVAKFAGVVVSPAWNNLILTHPGLIKEVCEAVGGRLTTLNKGK